MKQLVLFLLFLLLLGLTTQYTTDTLKEIYHEVPKQDKNTTKSEHFEEVQKKKKPSETNGLC